MDCRCAKESKSLLNNLHSDTKIKKNKYLVEKTQTAHKLPVLVTRLLFDSSINKLLVFKEDDRKKSYS